MKNGTTFYLASDLVPLVDRLKKDRQDPQRADTIRFLLLRALADLSYLPESQKKALGVLIK